MFTERQLQYIAYQAQLTADGFEGDMLDLNEYQFAMAMTAEGILCDLVLPPDWQPDHEQRDWLGVVLKTAQGVYREEIAKTIAGNRQEALELMDDLELCTSVLRSMMVVTV